MTPAEILRKTADHIDRVGLYQDGRYFAVIDRDARCKAPCCTIGAMLCVLTDGNLQFPFFGEHWFTVEAQMAKRALIKRVKPAGPYDLESYIADWSDHTPQDEVVATLREVAAELEKNA